MSKFLSCFFLAVVLLALDSCESMESSSTLAFVSATASTDRRRQRHVTVTGPLGSSTEQGSGPPMPRGGGPPSSSEGPPGGAGGPPGRGGPPSSPGGPPAEPTAAQKVLEQAFEVAFSLLYLGDDSGIRDSSKNLRVLWTRALLANLNKIQDDIAYELLPRKTRWVVGKNMAGSMWQEEGLGGAAVAKLDWVVNRTTFIDAQLEEFLAETHAAPARQVIVLGSGYDTRALRYQRPGLQYFEVDLPDIANTKATMVRRYLDEQQHAESNSNGSCPDPIHVPFDLNEVLTKNQSLVDTLQTQYGFQVDNNNVPTMIICEAVLFYLIPTAVQKLVAELFALGSTRYCFTDNLSKVGVTPGPPMPTTARQKCETWLEANDKELVAHDAIWGGAIHFAGFTSRR